MSKERWFADYEKRLNELADTGMSAELIEDEASHYADGWCERAMDQADYLRKARREENVK